MSKSSHKAAATATAHIWREAKLKIISFGWWFGMFWTILDVSSHFLSTIIWVFMSFLCINKSQVYSISHTFETTSQALESIYLRANLFCAQYGIILSASGMPWSVDHGIGCGILAGFEEHWILHVTWGTGRFRHNTNLVKLSSYGMTHDSWCFCCFTMNVFDCREPLNRT